VGLGGGLELLAQVRGQDVGVGGKLVERTADLSRRVVARRDAAVLPEVRHDRGRDVLRAGSGGHRRAGAERRHEGERQGADATHDRGRC
jgi:hypothetical protein